MPQEKRERLLTFILAFLCAIAGAAVWAAYVDGAPVPPPKPRPPRPVVPRHAMLSGLWRVELFPNGAYRAGVPESGKWSFVGSWKVVGKVLIIHERRVDDPASITELQYHWRKGYWQTFGGGKAISDTAPYQGEGP